MQTSIFNYSDFMSLLCNFYIFSLALYIQGGHEVYWSLRRLKNLILINLIPLHLNTLLQIPYRL